MTSPNPNKLRTALRELENHQRWLDEHGSTLIAYVARYGSAQDACHYGDGGEAIYAADVAALKKAELDVLREIKRKHQVTSADEPDLRAAAHRLLKEGEWTGGGRWVCSGAAFYALKDALERVPQSDRMARVCRNCGSTFGQHLYSTQRCPPFTTSTTVFG